jgi:WD40 repeat protein
VAVYTAMRARDARTDADRALAASYLDRVTPGEPLVLPLLAQAVRRDPDSAMARALLVGHLTRQVIPLAEMAHGAPVRTAVFNSTGTRLLTTSGSGTVRLWDPRTGQQIGDPLGQEGRVTASAFSPDGARVVTGSEDGTARIWLASSGEGSGASLPHGGAVRIVMFDRSGKRVVTASDDRILRIWHHASGDVIPITAASATIRWAEFDPTDTFILTISDEGDVAVRDAASGQPVSRFGFEMSNAEAVTGAWFSPDGTRIVTVLEDGTARVIDTRTGHTIGRPLRETQPGSGGPAGIIESARFDPSGSRVLTTALAVDADGQPFGAARLWDARTGLMLAMHMSHTNAIRTAGFSPDGSRVVTASDDGTARIWDTTTGLPLSPPLQHARAVAWAGFSPGGHRILTASDDGTAQLWDPRTGVETSGALRHEGPVTSAVFTSDGLTILTTSGDRARTWDARTGVIVEARLRHAEGQAVRPAAASPDTPYVATAVSAGGDASDRQAGRSPGEALVVRLWDSATGQSIGDPLRHAGAVNAVSFSPAGPPRLITASADGVARIWDATTGAPLGEPLRHRASVSAVAFDADGARVITASADGTARIWDVESDRPVIELNHCDSAACTAVSAAAFNPDGTRVITGAADGNARLWNPWTGELIATLPMACAGSSSGAGESGITAAGFSPDGERLLMSSGVTSVLWNVPRLEAIHPCLSHLNAPNPPVSGTGTGRDVLQIVTMSTVEGARLWEARPAPVVRWDVPRQIAVLSAGFSGDGRLVTGSGDGASRTWNVRTGKDAGLTLHRDAEPTWTAFGSNSSRVVTVAADGVARVWDVPAGGRDDSEKLAELAEAIAGHALDPAGGPSLPRPGALAQLRNRSARQPTGESFAETLTQWLFADPATRTITPVSRITVPEYVARLRQEGEPGEREAMRLFPWLSAGRR